MEKKKLKNRLKEFYQRLSIIRKNKNMSSKSISWLEKDSHKKFHQLIGMISFKDASFADIGGADGGFIFQLAREGRLSSGSKATLIDISPYYLALARKKYNSCFKGDFKFKTIQSDVDDIDLKNEFDVVFLRSILEHLYFPGDSLERINKSMKKNGFLLIITPNRNRLNQIIKKFIPKSLKRNLQIRIGTDSPDVLLLEEKMNLKEHIHEYSITELKGLLGKHGFKVNKINYSSVPFIAPSFCDRSPIVYKIQRAVIGVMNMLKLNNFLGFEYIIIAKKIR